MTLEFYGGTKNFTKSKYNKYSRLPQARNTHSFFVFNSDHEEWMKELSYYDQHHVTDFLTAAKMQFIITIPLMQFAIIFWGERLINMNDNPEIHDLDIIRYSITA